MNKETLSFKSKLIKHQKEKIKVFKNLEKTIITDILNENDVKTRLNEKFITKEY